MRYVNKNSFPLMFSDKSGGMVSVLPGRFTQDPWFEQYCNPGLLTKEEDKEDAVKSNNNVKVEAVVNTSVNVEVKDSLLPLLDTPKKKYKSKRINPEEDRFSLNESMEQLGKTLTSSPGIPEDAPPIPPPNCITVRCGLCNEEFNGAINLKEHLKEKHPPNKK